MDARMSVMAQSSMRRCGGAHDKVPRDLADTICSRHTHQDSLLKVEGCAGVGGGNKGQQTCTSRRSAASTSMAAPPAASSAWTRWPTISTTAGKLLLQNHKRHTDFAAAALANTYLSREVSDACAPDLCITVCSKIPGFFHWFLFSQVMSVAPSSCILSHQQCFV